MYIESPIALAIADSKTVEQSEQVLVAAHPEKVPDSGASLPFAAWKLYLHGTQSRFAKNALSAQLCPESREIFAKINAKFQGA